MSRKPDAIIYPTIAVTRKGRKIFAMHCKGADVMEIAVARCSPTDKFDFKCGMNLALERLFEQMRGNQCG